MCVKVWPLIYRNNNYKIFIRCDYQEINASIHDMCHIIFKKIVR